jgi:dolichol-phosphate mannosyltransferase
MNDSANEVEISTVVPVYGCADCLEALHRSLCTVLEAMNVSFEIVLVDDCARDGSWPVIQRLATADPRVHGILLSRNYGQQIAITAGLAAARGRWIVTMDCDLQDPPDAIPRLFQAAREGNDIVYGRSVGKKNGILRVLASHLYWKLQGLLAGHAFDPALGSLTMISRQVVRAFLQFEDRDRHYLHILKWLGFRSTEIEYAHRERHKGTSAYSFAKLLRVAFDGMIFQTTNLLRWIVYAGFATALAGIALAVALAFYSVTHPSLPGWTSLMVVTLLCSGMTTTSVGVCGLYLGKVFEQVRGRPLYVIRTTTECSEHGLEGPAETAMTPSASTSDGSPLEVASPQSSRST